MKKTSVTFILILLASLGFAQQKRSSLSILFGNAPRDFKVGWYDVDAESIDDYDVEKYEFSVGLIYQQQLNENANFRVRLSYLGIILNEYHNDEFFHRGAEVRQNKFQLAPGIVFPFVSRRFSMYGGFELPLYYHGEIRMQTYLHLPNPSRPGGNTNDYLTIPHGFSGGIAPLIGFTYSISRVLFCESEFSMLCLYGKTGGKTIVSNAAGEGSTQDSMKGLSYEPRIGFGLGVRIGKRQKAED